LDALSDNPVVFLAGARQTGKSTLAQSIRSSDFQARYLTLDDAGVLAAAQNDASGFLGGLTGPLILDEVQRAPELFPAIKILVDRNRQPGQFLLTGSANVLLLPQISESLAGRMEILTLWPFSQGEIEGTKESFVDHLFTDDWPSPPTQPAHRTDLYTRVLHGGFPEILKRPSDRRRRAWFGSYVTAILQRDVRDLAHIEGLSIMPRLMSLLSARATSLLNFSELSRSVGIPQTTLKRYISLLETTFLICFVPAWSGNLSKRLVKSPKTILIDTGLMAYLQGIDQERLMNDPTLTGPILENFVVMELRKQITWSQNQPSLFHLRAQTGQEVDILLEDRAGRLVGIEVKTAASAQSRDFKGLRLLSQELGDRFLRGVVFYVGQEIIPFAKNLHAIPINALWCRDQK
jgi:hypothetical protein